MTKPSFTDAMRAQYPVAAKSPAARSFTETMHREYNPQQSASPVSSVRGFLREYQTEIIIGLTVVSIIIMLRK